MIKDINVNIGDISVLVDMLNNDGNDKDVYAMTCY